MTMSLPATKVFFVELNSTEVRGRPVELDTNVFSCCTSSAETVSCLGRSDFLQDCAKVITVSRARLTRGLSPHDLDFNIGRLVLLILKIDLLDFIAQYYFLHLSNFVKETVFENLEQIS
jgi:hypothetical protein